MDNYESGIYTDNPDDTLRYQRTAEPLHAVTVVPCRECRYGHLDMLFGGGYWCNGDMHSGDFYCAHGERK